MNANDRARLAILAMEVPDAKLKEQLMNMAVDNSDGSLTPDMNLDESLKAKAFLNDKECMELFDRKHFKTANNKYVQLNQYTVKNNLDNENICSLQRAN